MATFGNMHRSAYFGTEIILYSIANYRYTQKIPMFWCKNHFGTRCPPGTPSTRGAVRFRNESAMSRIGCSRTGDCIRTWRDAGLAAEGVRVHGDVCGNGIETCALLPFKLFLVFSLLESFLNQIKVLSFAYWTRVFLFPLPFRHNPVCELTAWELT
jgi:hypothetical protein